MIQVGAVSHQYPQKLGTDSIGMGAQEPLITSPGAEDSILLPVRSCSPTCCWDSPFYLIQDAPSSTGFFQPPPLYSGEQEGGKGWGEQRWDLGAGL